MDAAQGRKLSSRARLALEEAGTRGGGAGERVDLLIRTAGVVGEDAWERLRAAGADVRTMAGDVCTASAPLSALAALAGLDEVVAIDIAGELWPEEPTGGAPEEGS